MRMKLMFRNDFARYVVILGSPKLQIEKLQEHGRVCVISKPPQTRIISKSQQLGEITEEDEEKSEAEETDLKPQTQLLTLDNLQDPLKRFQAIILLYYSYFN